MDRNPSYVFDLTPNPWIPLKKVNFKVVDMVWMVFTRDRFTLREYNKL
jgi:hypothetical protein